MCQINDVAVLVSICALDQLIFQDLLCHLCAIGANGCIAVHGEDVVGILVHNELEGSLVAVGRGVDIGIHADVLKADFLADDGAAAIVAQNIDVYKRQV